MGKPFSNTILRSQQNAGERPTTWKTQPISFLELFPIMARIHIWAPQLRNIRIIIHTDYQALEHAINNSTSKNADMMALVRTLAITCMQFNVQMCAKHVPGKLNTLRLPCRFPITKFVEKAPWSDHQPTSIPEHILPLNWSLT